MKKVFCFIITIIMYCLFVPTVYAMDMGMPSTTEDYEDDIFMTGSTQEYIVRAGSRHTIVVDYDSYYDDSDISKIDVSINAPQDFRVTSSDSKLGSNMSLTGNGNNYSITRNDTTQDIEGVGLFIMTFPNITSPQEYNVTATAKSYKIDGSIKETKTINVKYYVLVRSTTCDSNIDVTVTASTGNFEKNSTLFGDTYTHTTPNSTSNITIKPNSSKTKISYIGESLSFSSEYVPNYSPSINLNNQNLNYGENTFAYEVASECAIQSNEWRQKTSGVFLIGGFDWYNEVFYNSNYIVLVVNRPDTRSNVNTLKSLSISDLSISFKPALKNYMGTVPYKVSSVKISSQLTDAKSSYVSGYGNRTVKLNEGSNDIQIKVRAENGNETTYSIKITREKNNDSTLKTIKVDDNDIIVKEGTLKYTHKVDNKIVKPVITAIPNDSNAKVEIDSFEELKEGDNTINIIVTASNGMKSNYVVNIIRDKLISTNSKLKKITIDNHDISFDSDVLKYKVKLSEDEDKLNIKVETSNEKATYLITGNKDLKDKSVIKVKVTAEDNKTITTYIIEIEKESSKAKIGLLPIIIIIILILAVIIFVLRKNKKNKTNNEEQQDTPEENNLNQAIDNSIPVQTEETNVQQSISTENTEYNNANDEIL